jgi:hypothetical protein
LEEKLIAVLGGGRKKKRTNEVLMETAVNYASDAYKHRVKAMYPDGPVSRRKVITVKRSHTQTQTHTPIISSASANDLIMSASDSKRSGDRINDSSVPLHTPTH